MTYSSRNGDVCAVDDVSVSAAGHEIIALVGPSGCGKTTLLKIIAGLIEPSSGAVRIDGAAPRRQQSALVFQDHGLFPWMSVAANVAFGLEMLGIDRAQARERACEFLQRVGLATFADRYPTELSIGMQQRVGFARAFLTDRPLLLLDEPFAALDAQTRRVLRGELVRLWLERPHLVLLVTHDIREAIGLADRVLVLSGRPGRILEEFAVPMSIRREPDSGGATEAIHLRRQIWALLEDEVKASLAVTT
jgi:NitT/TauT family transport system ATP-binding protein